MIQFPNHGDFKIQVQGRLIRSELIGPWNIETARDYMKRLEAVVDREMTGRPWASLVICVHSILFPMEMIAPLRASVQRRAAESGQVAVAMVVAPDVEGYGLLYPVIRGIYAGLLPFEIFETADEATAWLARLLPET